MLTRQGAPCGPLGRSAHVQADCVHLVSGPAFHRSKHPGQATHPVGEPNLRARVSTGMRNACIMLLKQAGSGCITDQLQD